MNERIKELAEQAGLEWGPGGYADYSDFDHSLFALLIVRECMDIAYEYDAPKMSGPGMIIANRIDAHFGLGMSVEDKKTLIKELLGIQK
jgi:hypothetical protein